MFKFELNKIYHGDASNVLKKLPNESINMVITSPPYWALRDYGVAGQLGLEKTFEEYIKKLCDIFDEVKRVLKKDGTCWVNLGDTYSATRWSNNVGTSGRTNRKMTPNIKKELNLSEKSLCQIPSRFAIEMTNRGWILRNEIIWHKPNCMPSSVKDRFTVDFEKVFFFVKNKKYYFEPQYEKFLSNNYDRARMATAREEHGGKWAQDAGGAIKTQRAFVAGHQEGRNKRCVWSICPEPTLEAHFAVYPQKLIEAPIKAGCPEGGGSGRSIYGQWHHGRSSEALKQKLCRDRN